MKPFFVCARADCRFTFEMGPLLGEFRFVGAYINLRCGQCGGITQIVLRQIYLGKELAELKFQLTSLPHFARANLVCLNDLPAEVRR